MNNTSVLNETRDQVRHAQEFCIALELMAQGVGETDQRACRALLCIIGQLESQLDLSQRNLDQLQIRLSAKADQFDGLNRSAESPGQT